MSRHDDSIRLGCYKEAMKILGRAELESLLVFQHLLLAHLTINIPGVVGMLCTTDSPYAKHVEEGGKSQDKLITEAERLYNLKISGN